MKYQSVIGFGQASFIEDIEVKHHACELIMRQYTDEPQSFLPEALAKVAIIKVTVESMTGKQS